MSSRWEPHAHYRRVPRISVSCKSILLRYEHLFHTYAPKDYSSLLSALNIEEFWKPLQTYLDYIQLALSHPTLHLPFFQLRLLEKYQAEERLKLENLNQSLLGHFLGLLQTKCRQAQLGIASTHPSLVAFVYARDHPDLARQAGEIYCERLCELSGDPEIEIPVSVRRTAFRQSGAFSQIVEQTWVEFFASQVLLRLIGCALINTDIRLSSEKNPCCTLAEEDFFWNPITQKFCLRHAGKDLYFDVNVFGRTYLNHFDIALLDSFYCFSFVLTRPFVSLESDELDMGSKEKSKWITLLDRVGMTKELMKRTIDWILLHVTISLPRSLLQLCLEYQWSFSYWGMSSSLNEKKQGKGRGKRKLPVQEAPSPNEVKQLISSLAPASSIPACAAEKVVVPIPSCSRLALAILHEDYYAISQVLYSNEFWQPVQDLIHSFAPSDSPHINLLPTSNMMNMTQYEKMLYKTEIYTKCKSFLSFHSYFNRLLQFQYDNLNKHEILFTLLFTKHQPQLAEKMIEFMKMREKNHIDSSLLREFRSTLPFPTNAIVNESYKQHKKQMKELLHKRASPTVIQTIEELMMDRYKVFAQKQFRLMIRSSER
jgi:hypothetical protein